MKSLCIVFLTLGLILMPSNPGIAATSAEEDQARTQGREIAAVLFGPEAASLWPRIGEPLQGLIGSAEGLAQMSAQLQAQMGPEEQLVSESIELDGAGFHYRRVATHRDAVAPLAIEVHVDGAGVIQGLRVAPEARLDTGTAPPMGEGQLPGDERLQSLIDAYVASGGAPGVVLGVLDRDGRRLLAAGTAGDGAAPDADTVFEAGSITKGLTGLLLAQMVEAGDVRAEQPIGSLFPADVPLSPLIAAITLQELATHESGLPRVSQGLLQRAASSPADPYAGTTVDGILADTAALDGEAVAAARGRFAYSNLGSALLGQLLARAGDADYETLLAERVFDALGLQPPMLAPTQVTGREALGHSAGRPVPSWRLDAYAPAGAWRASATQVLDLAERLLAGEPHWVAEALRVQGRGEGDGIGLAWLHDRVKTRSIIWHNGGTGGFRSFLAVVPAESLAVVVLANGDASVDELALAVLDPGHE